MDMSQYRDLFLAEAREHLQNMSELITEFESSPPDQEKINALFRSAHSLKGMAASMDYGPVADLAHRMEDLITRIRGGEFSFGGRVSSLLLEGVDLLALFIDDIAAGRPFSSDITPLSGRFADFNPSSEAEGATPPAIYTAPGKPTVARPERISEPIHTVRVRTEILDRLIDTTGELFTNRYRLQSITEVLDAPRLKETLNDLGRLLRELHLMVMQARLVPFARLADRFPHVVRDLARQRGKELSFIIEGREVELDRRVLEELADPLLHILRNAVDHGIEAPEKRKVAGKQSVGRIRLSAYRDRDLAVIEVEDDGRGMDPDRLVETAVARGLISAEQGAALSPGEAFMLTCLAGFSTAEEVTDISGRGVGMDAVRATVQSMGGSLAIESVAGLGSRIILRLPVRIAIINVLLVATGDCRVALPVSSVMRTLEIKREEMLFRDRRPYLLLDDEEVPLLSLSRILGLPEQRDKGGFIPVIIARFKGKVSGLLAERVLGQREIHVKPIGRPLNRMSGLAGGGILGDGEVVFVLDPATLL